MDITGSGGGGIMLALAAGLWLVYLVPTWLRRREYLATERNAVRLQQTLRVLAETAEVPVAVRAEATARSVAEQQRTLRQMQQQAMREARAVEAAHRAREAAALRRAERIAEAQPAAAAVVTARALAARRLRRTRLFSSMVLFAAIVTAIVQVVLMASTGIAAGAWLVLGFSAVAVVTSIALLGRLAAVSRARAALVAERAPLRKTMSAGVRVEPVALASTWTPVPVPKPLYLSRAVMEQVVVEADIAAEQLRAAAAEAQERLRAAERAVPALPVAEPLEPFTRAEPGQARRTLRALDIDEVLRRRRAAG
jgi:D-ribose pyranose/furanose isomerase RbsD